MFFELAESASLLISLVFLYGFILKQWRDNEWVAKAVTGALFGFVCIVGMRFPITVEPGIFFDARTVIISLSGVFAGPLGGSIAAAISAGYRLWLGGGGALVGVTVILMALGTGLIYRKLVDNNRLKLKAASLLGLGLVVHLCEIILFSFLPATAVNDVMSSVALPLLFIYTPATVLLGLALKWIEAHLSVKKELARVAQEKAHALSKVVHVLCSALEMRDAYTAGHQNQVAEISVKIGKALGYDSHRLEGLEIAATVHDIGKIQVPAEILSKPTRLTPQEFELIKCHSDVGADLLKDVRFDWPIADIVRQHHERLDGKGYPQGLRGNQIHEEAKIIAVADTVDAIANHRPYRPGRGVAVAKAEILAGRGVKYEPRVVDACIQLIDTGAIAF